MRSLTVVNIDTLDRNDERTKDSSSGPLRRNAEENLMMLSLLDFAGQSAYYACHHIFFSPRVFFILVVDMSKDLDKTPEQACNKPNLINSSWTYAGTKNVLLHLCYLFSGVFFFLENEKTTLKIKQT